MIGLALTDHPWHADSGEEPAMPLRDGHGDGEQSCVGSVEVLPRWNQCHS